MSGEAVINAKTSPIADRIRAYVAERQRAEPRYSLRRMSAEAGQAPTYLALALRRMDGGATVSPEILRALAQVMGEPLSVLLGEAPRAHDVPTFGELAQWPAAVTEATARYLMRPEGLAAIARWRPDAVPQHIDGAFVGSLYRAWDDLHRRT